MKRNLQLLVSKNNEQIQLIIGLFTICPLRSAKSLQQKGDLKKKSAIALFRVFTARVRH